MLLWNGTVLRVSRVWPLWHEKAYLLCSQFCMYVCSVVFEMWLLKKYTLTCLQCITLQHVYIFCKKCSMIHIKWISNFVNSWRLHATICFAILLDASEKVNENVILVVVIVMAIAKVHQAPSILLFGVVLLSSVFLWVYSFVAKCDRHYPFFCLE